MERDSGGRFNIYGRVNLENGTDTSGVNPHLTSFLDDSEGRPFNSMYFPYTDGTLQAALKSKIKYFRENVGKKVTAVVPQFTGANYEGIISVDNGVILSDGTTLTAAQACAWWLPPRCCGNEHDVQYLSCL
jgi:hypothetical protein